MGRKPKAVFEITVVDGVITSDFAKMPKLELLAKDIILHAVLAAINKNLTTFRLCCRVVKIDQEQTIQIVFDPDAVHHMTINIAAPELLIINTIRRVLDGLTESQQVMAKHDACTEYVSFPIDVYQTRAIPEDMKPTKESTKNNPLSEPVVVPDERVFKIQLNCGFGQPIFDKP